MEFAGFYERIIINKEKVNDYLKDWEIDFIDFPNTCIVIRPRKIDGLKYKGGDEIRLYLNDYDEDGIRYHMGEENLLLRVYRVSGEGDYFMANKDIMRMTGSIAIPWESIEKDLPISILSKSFQILDGYNEYFLQFLSSLFRKVYEKSYIPTEYKEELGKILLKAYELKLEDYRHDLELIEKLSKD